MALPSHHTSLQLILICTLMPLDAFKSSQHLWLVGTGCCILLRLRVLQFSKDWDTGTFTQIFKIGVAYISKIRISYIVLYSCHSQSQHHSLVLGFIMLYSSHSTHCIVIVASSHSSYSNHSSHSTSIAKSFFFSKFYLFHIYIKKHPKYYNVATTYHFRMNATPSSLVVSQASTISFF